MRGAKGSATATGQLVLFRFLFSSEIHPEMLKSFFKPSWDFCCHIWTYVSRDIVVYLYHKCTASCLFSFIPQICVRATSWGRHQSAWGGLGVISLALCSANKTRKLWAPLTLSIGLKYPCHAEPKRLLYIPSTCHHEHTHTHPNWHGETHTCPYNLGDC